MLSDLEKKKLKQQIKSNQHEVFVVSFEQMDAIVTSSPKGRMDHIQNAWKKIKGTAGFFANYTAGGSDILTLNKLLRDLGSPVTKAYIKTYAGKPHIILKGYPGLRKVLTGTKYGITNPKVITMGLGKAGAIHAAKIGGVISLVLLTGYRLTECFLADEPMWSQLIGSLATDFVKVGITTGASIFAATAASGFTIAIGPIVAVVVIGIGLTMALNAFDEHYGITDRVIVALDELGDDVNSHFAQVKDNMERKATGALNYVIDYTVQTGKKILIETARHHLDRFLSGTQRVY